jgi:UDP-N-acetylmuramoylalanine-D-glutamate ligase
MSVNTRVEQKLRAIIAYAQKAFPKIRKCLEVDKEGCVITVRYGDRLNFLNRTDVIERPPIDKYEGSLGISQEKAQRMVWHASFSSFQTREPENQKWGGAVCAIPYAISISGLKELDDEAFALAIAAKTGVMPVTTADAISEFSKNHDRWRDMFDALKDLPFEG